MKIKRCNIRSFNVDSVDKDSSTNSTFIPMSISSESPVLQKYGNEILLHSEDSINFSRTMPNGLPLLVNHNDTVLPVGRLKNIRLDPDTKKLRGDAYFSGRSEAQSVRQDILDDIISDVSVGYRIDDYKVVKPSSKDMPNDFIVTKWTPYEVSLVGIPADNNVGIGRSLKDDEDLDVDLEDTEEDTEDKENRSVDTSEDTAEETLTEAEQNDVEAVEASLEAIEGDIEASETTENAGTGEVENPLGVITSDEDIENNKDDNKEEDTEDKTEDKTEDDEDTKQRNLDILAIKNNAEMEILNIETKKSELLALRNFAISQKLKSDEEIDLILSKTTDITEAKRMLLDVKTKEKSIIIKENRKMNPELELRNLANALKGNFADVESDGFIKRTSERNFNADLFTRADTWAGDTVASNMTTTGYGNEGNFQQYIGFLDLLRARTVCLAAGAKTKTGSGSLSYLREAIPTTVVNKAEDSGLPTNSYVDFVKVPYTPHALVSTVYLTDELQKESLVNLQEVLRNDMVKQFALKLDAMAINGVTSPYTVTGLLASGSGVQNGNLTTAGKPTFVNVNNLKALVDQYAVDLQASAYILTPGLMGFLESTSKFAGGIGLPIADSGKINGYKALTSTNLPIASGTNHAIVFGDFSNLEFALMGPTEFMVDIQTRFAEGITILTARQYVDIGILQPNAFASATNFQIA